MRTVRTLRYGYVYSQVKKVLAKLDVVTGFNGHMTEILPRALNFKFTAISQRRLAADPIVNYGVARWPRNQTRSRADVRNIRLSHASQIDCSRSILSAYQLRIPKEEDRTKINSVIPDQDG